MRNRHLFTLVMCILLFSIIYIEAVRHWTKIKSTGNIVTLGVKCDTAIIYWGTLEPNTITTYTIHVWLTSNVNATLLLNTTNWVPQNASTFMALTWNYTGKILEPDEIATIVLQLYVAPDISITITTFSFDMIISAERN